MVMAAGLLYLVHLLFRRQNKTTIIKTATDAIFSASREPLLLVNSAYQMIRMSSAFLEMTGFVEEELKNQSLEIIASDKQVIKTFIDDSFLSAQTASVIETKLKTKSGANVDVSLSASVIGDKEKFPFGAIVTVKNITEKKKAKEKVDYLLFHDSVTNLPNMSLFQDRLFQSLASAEQHKTI